MKNSNFYNAAQIAEMLEISRSQAYSVIRELNEELRSKGYMFIRGRISKRYFNQRYYDYAVRYYDLPRNPCTQCGPIGKGAAKEMQYITQQEFGKLIECLEDDIARMAIETMFYTGVRLGEALALTVGDIDVDKKTLSVTKSLQRIKGEDVITDPKTEKSKRCITIPRFLSDHLEEYISKLYGKDKKIVSFQCRSTILAGLFTRGLRQQDLKKSGCMI